MRTCRSPIGLFLTKGRTHPIVGRHPAEESIVRSFRVLSQKSFEPLKGASSIQAIEPKLELKISFISQLLSRNPFLAKVCIQTFFLHLINFPQPDALGLQDFKSRQRKVMQEDLATILIKVRINFHQIPCYFDPL